MDIFEGVGPTVWSPRGGMESDRHRVCLRNDDRGRLADLIGIFINLSSMVE